MKRQTFIKQLMAMGISRNEANDMCRDALLRRDYANMHDAISFVTYGNAFAYVFFNYSYGVHLTGRLLTAEERQKFRAWRKKHPLQNLGGAE